MASRSKSVGYLDGIVGRRDGNGLSSYAGFGSPAEDGDWVQFSSRSLATTRWLDEGALTNDVEDRVGGAYIKLQRELTSQPEWSLRWSLMGSLFDARLDGGRQTHRRESEVETWHRFWILYRFRARRVGRRFRQRLRNRPHLAGTDVFARFNVSRSSSDQRNALAPGLAGLASCRRGCAVGGVADGTGVFMAGVAVAGDRPLGGSDLKLYQCRHPQSLGMDKL